MTKLALITLTMIHMPYCLIAPSLSCIVSLRKLDLAMGWVGWVRVGPLPGLEKVDSIVMFRPFDFDALAEKILKEINGNFHKTVGLECLLEVGQKVMEQLLAAAYLYENDKVVNDWAEQVLNWAFVEVSRKYNISAHCVVKLGVCEENLGGGHLPTKIFIN